MPSISSLLEEMREGQEMEQFHYGKSQEHRLYHLEGCRKAGEALSKIKKMFEEHGVPNKSIETDLGTFSSWREFCESQGINRETDRRYRKLADNWELAKEMGCLEYYQRYRLTQTVKAIEWGLRVKAEDPNANPTVEQFQEERNNGTSSKKSDSNKPSYQELENRVEYLYSIVDQEDNPEETVSKEVYEKVKAERDNLRERVSTLEAKVSNLQAQLNRGQPAQSSRVITRTRSS